MMMMSSSSALWSAADAARATGGKATGDWMASGVSIDSRTVETGDLFVALQGPNFDGHKFISDAFAKHATAAMVTQPPQETSPAVGWLEVDDTFRALNNLGRAGRARSEGVVIAITGSVGKTSLKAAVAELLGHQASTSSSRGSFNNHFGAPLSLARLPAQAKYGVFELGMNHAGELRALTELVRPHVAVVTNVEAAHLEHFNSVDEIADAKAEIFEGVVPNGAVVLNRDNAYFSHLAAAAKAAGVERTLSFGRHPDAHVRAVDVIVASDGSQVEADIEGVRIRFNVAQPGDHWVMNGLAALATILAAGGDVAMAASAVGALTPVEGRGARVRLGRDDFIFDLIDDSYNASPAAVGASLQSFAALKPRDGGRRIVILGDMLELGEGSKGLHIAIADQVVAAGADLAFAAGPMMRHMFDALPDDRRGGWSETADQLASLVGAVVQDGDVVLVKGSAGMRMSLIVNALRDLTPLAPAAPGRQ